MPKSLRVPDKAISASTGANCWNRERRALRRAGRPRSEQQKRSESYAEQRSDEAVRRSPGIGVRRYQCAPVEALGTKVDRTAAIG